MCVYVCVCARAFVCVCVAHLFLPHRDQKLSKKGVCYKNNVYGNIYISQCCGLLLAYITVIIIIMYMCVSLCPFLSVFSSWYF